MKFEQMKSCVLRSYVALARGERIEPSQIATWDVYEPRRGELLESIPFGQLTHEDDADLLKLMLEKRQVTPERFAELMIFRRPSELQNAIYSAMLRRRYPRTVAQMDEFSNGVMQLPRPSGVMVPIKTNNLITRLAFVPLSKIVAARSA